MKGWVLVFSTGFGYLFAELIKRINIKWVPENMYTFSVASQIVNVYKFSGTHFIKWGSLVQIAKV